MLRKRIIQVQEAEVVVSQDHATALKPGQQNETKSETKQNKKGWQDDQIGQLWCAATSDSDPEGR